MIKSNPPCCSYLRQSAQKRTEGGKLWEQQSCKAPSKLPSCPQCLGIWIQKLQLWKGPGVHVAATGGTFRLGCATWTAGSHRAPQQAHPHGHCFPGPAIAPSSSAPSPCTPVPWAGPVTTQPISKGASQPAFRGAASACPWVRGAGGGRSLRCPLRALAAVPAQQGEVWRPARSSVSVTHCPSHRVCLAPEYVSQWHACVLWGALARVSVAMGISSYLGGAPARPFHWGDPSSDPHKTLGWAGITLCPHHTRCRAHSRMLNSELIKKKMPLYNGCVRLQSLAWVSPTSLFQFFLLVLVTWGKHLGEREGPQVGGDWWLRPDFSLSLLSLSLNVSQKVSSTHSCRHSQPGGCSFPPSYSFAVQILQFKGYQISCLPVSLQLRNYRTL